MSAVVGRPGRASRPSRDPLAPARATRWVIGVVIGTVFAVPLVSTLLYTLRDGDGYSLTNWANLLDPELAARYAPLWVGLRHSLVLALVTVAIVLLLLAPTMILVNLRFPRLRRGLEFLALLPLSVPAIVLVVGLAPIYLVIGRSIGTDAWTLAFAYGILVLPFAFRAIQANIDAISLRTLVEAARTLGAGWLTVGLRILAPNLRQGLLAASLISVAVVLGEFTIASLLNRQVLQTAMLVVSKQDVYAAQIFALLALLLAFLLLLLIGRLGGGRRRARRPSRKALR